MFEFLRDKDIWGKVRSDKRYEPLRKQLDRLYQEICKDIEIPILKYSDYKIFFCDGSRSEYEKPYFIRRKQLAVYAVLCMVYEGNAEFLEKLEDVIWSICDEYCWALPAHMSEQEHYNDNTFLDLFACETGFAFAEIKYILKGRLSPLIVDRMEAELDRRIIKSFLYRHHAFETWTNNWAAVCAGSLGAAMMLENPKVFKQVKPRLDKTMDCYLSGFLEDGACTEGISYWNYGFGFFLCYSDLLKRFTGVKEDYFKSSKVEKIAAFMPALFLDGDCTVSFSDGSRYSTYNIGVAHYLKKIYQDSFELPKFKVDGILDNCGRWCTFVRSFLFFDPDLSNQPAKSETEHFFQDSMWYIKRSENYSFAAKGGHNDEPHNHNDIGSFIVAKAGRQVLCDLGAGRYTKQYFSSQRYSILVNSSRGHSVPFINGKEQQNGAEYFGTMEVKGNDVIIDMKNAYEKSNLKKLIRTFTLSDKIVLKDSFEGDISIKERLVTLIEPKIEKGIITLEDTRILYDHTQYTVSYQMEESKNHSSEMEQVYLIDFVPLSDAKEFIITII